MSCGCPQVNALTNQGVDCCGVEGVCVNISVDSMITPRLFELQGFEEFCRPGQTR